MSSRCDDTVRVNVVHCLYMAPNSVPLNLSSVFFANQNAPTVRVIESIQTESKSDCTVTIGYGSRQGGPRDSVNEFAKFRQSLTHQDRLATFFSASLLVTFCICISCDQEQSNHILGIIKSSITTDLSKGIASPVVR